MSVNQVKLSYYNIIKTISDECESRESLREDMSKKFEEQIKI